MTILLPTIGYGASAAAFAVLAVAMVSVFRGRLQGSYLFLACLATVIWSVLLALVPVSSRMTTFHIFLAELLIDGVWLFFLASLMRGAVVSERTWVLRFGGLILTGAVLLIGAALQFVAKPGDPGASSIFVMGALGTTLYGLVGVEQIYRNARQSQQNGLKFLALGSAPLIATSASRSPSWAPGLFLSRQVVFYTTTLIAAGVYLFIVGLIGYYIQNLNLEWGPTAQLVFFAAAVLVFLIFLLSDQTRARIRVFIAKHFFENKYDYREEWLRLITTLTGSENKLPLKKRAIKAVGDILDVRSGVLWYRDSNGECFLPDEGWGVGTEGQSVRVDHPLLRFLQKSGWIIDIRELHVDPEKYQDLDLKDIERYFPGAAFICPLVHEDDLVGFITLGKPHTPVKLNFEDHDLLKTVGHQIAGYLEQANVADKLSESKQFEAFNKLTAYIMHDLKNAIAQQSLVVENAEKHKRNPEFIDDAIETISGSVVRMKRVISHLRQGKVDLLQQKVDVPTILRRAVKVSSDRTPSPILLVPDFDVNVEADEDRLFMAVCHAIRNAQDATQESGSISVSGAIEDHRFVIRVSDTGVGMDAEFVRDHLFKPFESSKGAEGMGIGAYQIQETIRAAGGEVYVESEPGKGTTFSLILPVTDRN
jgi:putative PEP-CTERM system histidine kinase